jgi:D-alanine-D-alanine ligase
MNVVLLHDRIAPNARPDELDSLVQVEAVSQVLTKLGHACRPLPFSLDLRAVADALADLRPDVVFNFVESVEGHGRLIHLAPALLDALHLPYAGAGAEAIYVTSNKLLTKRMLRAYGLATPPWFTMTAPGAATAGPGRYIVKSVWEHASVGMEDDAIMEVDGPEALQRQLRNRAGRLGGEAFAESYIDGREFNLALLTDRVEPRVLPPAEIHFVDYPAGKPKVVGYRAKWVEDAFEYHHTPRCFDFPAEDQGLLDELRRLARTCWHKFELRGYARVDFRVDAAGQPWILEINTNPCLSPDAGFVAAAARGGLSLEDVVVRLLTEVTPDAAARCRRCGASDGA